MHTVPYKSQSQDINPSVTRKLDPTPTLEGKGYEVESTLSHREREREFQILTLKEGFLAHDAEWQPAKDFIDKDGTINKSILEYIKLKHIIIFSELMRLSRTTTGGKFEYCDNAYPYFCLYSTYGIQSI